MLVLATSRTSRRTGPVGFVNSISLQISEIGTADRVTHRLSCVVASVEQPFDRERGE